MCVYTVSWSRPRMAYYVSSNFSLTSMESGTTSVHLYADDKQALEASLQDINKARSTLQDCITEYWRQKLVFVAKTAAQHRQNGTNLVRLKADTRQGIQEWSYVTTRLRYLKPVVLVIVRDLGVLLDAWLSTKLGLQATASSNCAGYTTESDPLSAKKSYLS